MARSGWLVSCGLLGGLVAARGGLAVVCGRLATACDGLRRLVAAGWCLADARIGSRVVLWRLAAACGGSWWLAATGWCFAVSLGGSGRLAVVLRLTSRVGLVGGSRLLAGASRTPWGGSGRLAVVLWRLTVACDGSWGLTGGLRWLAVVFSGRPCGGSQ